MKISTKLFAVLAALGFAAGASAEEYSVRNVGTTEAPIYTAYVKASALSKGDIVIEDSISYGGQKYPVTHILKEGFKGAKITSIKFPKTLQYVGESAFAGCTLLESADFGESAATIERYAFEDCTSLKELNLGTGKGKRYIGNKAFKNAAVTSLIVPANVDSASAGAFNNMPITELIFEDGDTPIRYEHCYNDMYPLETIETVYYGRPFVDNGKGVEHGIGGATEVTFQNAYRLRSITFGPSVKKVPTYYCANDTALRSVTFADSSLIYIGHDAFRGCEALTEVKLPSTLVELGANAFENCYKLKKLDLGTGVRIIGGNAFNETAIEDLVIPVNVDSIASGSSFASKCLKHLVVEDGETPIHYNSYFGMPYKKDSLETVYYGRPFMNDYYLFNKCYKLDTVTFGPSVTWYPEFICSNDTTLRKVNFSGNETSISRCAFENTRLTEVVIPDSVKEIGSSAFTNCYLLKKLDLGTGVRIIGGDAFGNTAIEDLVIPVNVDSIASGSSFASKCLKHLVVEDGETPIHYNSYFGMPFSKDSLETVYYGRPLKDDYCTFNSCASMTEIKLGESVGWIPESFFYNCPKLTSVTCGSLVPPTIDGRDFYFVKDEIYQQATLYVPFNSLGAYKEAPLWQKFFKIDSGIASIESDSAIMFDPNAEAYNIFGQRVAKNYKGIVIQNGKKFILR